MFKVRGLPVDITKSNLDELFSPYGTIQKVEIKIENDQSIVFVKLDKNEELAIKKLDRTKWRGKYILYLDPVRGDGRGISQPGSGGGNNQDKKPIDNPDNLKLKG